MKKKRLESYLSLIQGLLDCPEGEELALLQAQEKLLDPELVKIMEQVAAQMAVEGDLERANFLHQWAKKLQAALERTAEVALNPARQSNVSPVPPVPPTQLAFLKRLLQVVQEKGSDPQRVYAFLQENPEQLDERLAETLRHWATAALPQLEPELARGIAALLVTLSDLLQAFPAGSPACNLEIALAGYESALPRFPRKDFPERWAAIQNNLGEAYCLRRRGDRAENVESAIQCFQAALQVYQPTASLWGIAQANLAAAYRQRLRGERVENLERALDAYAALAACLMQKSTPASPPQPSFRQPAPELEDLWA